MAEPGNETRAAAVGRGHLRASHADREQVIVMLKAAFVQGRLTKDELDARAGQAFAARTYAELAAITADLPAGLIAPPPGRPGRARARPSMGLVAAGAALITPLPAFVAAAFLTDSERLTTWFVFFASLYFTTWIVAGAQMLTNWHDKRSRGQLPPRRARARAPGGGQGGGMGDDLMLCEGRRDVQGRGPWVWKRSCRAGFC